MMHSYLYLLIAFVLFSTCLIAVWRGRKLFRNFLSGLFISTFVVSLLILLLDHYFTVHEVWSKNPQYITGLMLLGLPIEDYLFFPSIQFSGLLIHIWLCKTFPQPGKVSPLLYVITCCLILALGYVSIKNSSKALTFTTAYFTSLILLISMFQKKEVLFQFYKSCIADLFVLLLLFIGCGVFRLMIFSASETLPFRFFNFPLEWGFLLPGPMLLAILIFEVRKNKRNSISQLTIQSSG